MRYPEVKFEVFIPVKGSWRPLPGSNPYQGQPGKICTGEEMKVELRCKEEFIQEALTVIKEIHP